ncbi:MAG: Oligopeptide transport ATP-binding protein OppD [Anaerolineales bacterium]|nr:Oligopeptide transport ATP-binding protein OppD [Anaerolineales bacterium]
MAEQMFDTVSSPILEVRDLFVNFYTYRGVVRALNGVNLTIGRGEIVGLVGETGCGKSVTARSVLRLIRYPGKIEGGQILFEGQDLLALSEREMREFRGRQISMIMQEPKVSLNPAFTIGAQIAESIAIHDYKPLDDAQTEAIEILRTVRIADPEQVAHQYPHELSGGMAQRAMLAMMLAPRPKLLIADEPTSALDVTIQAQILNLMTELVEQIEASILLITHDLGVVAETCDKVAVMYAGNVVEYGTTEEVLTNPAHPYTRGLLRALPNLARQGPLYTIRGSVPDLVDPPAGCRFHPRCEYAMSECAVERPDLLTVKQGHFAACVLYEEGRDGIPDAAHDELPANVWANPDASATVGEQS